MNEISRSDLEELDIPAKITDVKHLSSYSWIEGPTPTIIVPGLPPLWNPPPGTQKLEKDSGFVYIAQNAARHPEYPLEPLFRSLFTAHPSFDLGSVDVITDRNNVRKLLQFVRPDRTSYQLEAFTIKVEVTQSTAVLCRTEAATSEVIKPTDFRGFGHQFERRYTTAEISDSTGHHRILSFGFCGMNFALRHETDGYVQNEATSHKGSEDNTLPNLLANLSLETNPHDPYITMYQSKLRVQDKGRVVPPDSIIEIKTRTTRRTIDIDEVAPQLWASQTPKLVRAYHVGGKFVEPRVEDVSAKIQSWEADNQPDLMRLGWLIKRIVSIAKGLGGKVVVQYDISRDKLAVHKNSDAGNMLPADVYTRWNNIDAAQRVNRGLRPDWSTGIDKAREADTKGAKERSLPEVGPMSCHEHVVRNDLPFAAIVRSAMDKGFRQVFRDMPTALGEYRTLCESFKASKIDVLQGRQVRDLMDDMRRGKEDWDPEERRKSSGSKTVARDSAFRLIYAFLQDQAKDCNTAYNATVFVVSHFRIFGYKIRKMVREAFEYQFVPSVKQRKGLEKWSISGDSQEDDATTEDDGDHSDFWDSDYS